jgi:hypothetical protein
MSWPAPWPPTRETFNRHPLCPGSNYIIPSLARSASGRSFREHRLRRHRVVLSGQLCSSVLDATHRRPAPPQPVGIQYTARVLGGTITVLW